jgi:hypothetical protein
MSTGDLWARRREPWDRSGRSRGVQLPRTLVAAGALALAAATASCANDGGAAGVEFAEAPVEVDDYDYVNGVVEWEDGFVAVTSSGVVFRSPDGDQWETLDATGLGGRESEGEIAVAGLAAGDGFLLAAGGRGVPVGEDEVETSPVVWRSEDGEAWEELETSGLTVEYTDALVAHDGAFLLFGGEEVPEPPGLKSDEEEEETGEPGTVPVTTVWRSSDGEQWEAVGDPVTPPGENSSEGLGAVAVIGDRLLASLGAECYDCYDDFSNALFRSDDRGSTWRELDDTGLDDLDLANTDVIPRVVGFEDGFVAVGTSQDGDDTVATLWRSTDGEKWTDKMQLGGPREYEYAADIDAMVATETGVVVLELRGDELAVWRVELD